MGAGPQVERYQPQRLTEGLRLVPCPEHKPGVKYHHWCRCSMSGMYVSRTATGHPPPGFVADWIGTAPSSPPGVASTAARRRPSSRGCRLFSAASIKSNHTPRMRSAIGREAQDDAPPHRTHTSRRPRHDADDRWQRRRSPSRRPSWDTQRGHERGRIAVLPIKGASRQTSAGHSRPSTLHHGRAEPAQGAGLRLPRPSPDPMGTGQPQTGLRM
jgi:hypothetical protein